MLSLRRELLLKHVKRKSLFLTNDHTYVFSHSSVFVSPNEFTDGVYVGETLKHCTEVTDKVGWSEIDILTDKESMESFNRLVCHQSVLSFVFVSDELKKAFAIFETDVLGRYMSDQPKFASDPRKLSLKLGYAKQSLVTFKL